MDMELQRNRKPMEGDPMKKLMMAALVPAFLAGCSQGTNQSTNQPQQDSLWGAVFNQQAQNKITIQAQDLSPIPGAQILIGDALNTPFEGNLLISDAQGQIDLPAGWTDAQPVTVQAPGYVRVTYLAQAPQALTFKLRKTPQLQQLEVRGNAQNLPVEDKDGYIDFGLVMNAFTKADMLSFDINNVISPQNDRIEVMGQNVDIPTNISLPKQSEKYSLFTVTLEKPLYRLYYGQPGINRVFAARGRFPFKSTVDEMRGGAEFYELINNFKINGGGIRDINVVPGQNRLDIPTRELNFTEKKEMMAPSIAGNEVFIAVGVANQSGYLIPTDVKNVDPSKKIALSTLPGAEQMILGVVKTKDELKNKNDRMSVTLVPFTAGAAPKMLSLMNDPSLDRNGNILLPRVATITGVSKIGTSAVFSREIELTQGSTKVKVMSPTWEVFAAEWVNTMDLPAWPNEAPAQGKKRWEVNFVGSQTSSQPAVGPAMIEAATHVTHSSVTF